MIFPVQWWQTYNTHDIGCARRSNFNFTQEENVIKTIFIFLSNNIIIKPAHYKKLIKYLLSTSHFLLYKQIHTNNAQVGLFFYKLFDFTMSGRSSFNIYVVGLG